MGIRLMEIRRQSRPNERINNRIARSEGFVYSIIICNSVCAEGRKQMLKNSQFFFPFLIHHYFSVCVRFFAIPSVPFHLYVIASFRYIQWNWQSVRCLALFSWTISPSVVSLHPTSSFERTSPTVFSCGFSEYAVCYVKCIRWVEMMEMKAHSCSIRRGNNSKKEEKKKHFSL